MSGLDKILEHIEATATETANKIIETANADAAKIVASKKEEAERQAAAINKQSDVNVLATSKRIQSAAEMTEKRIVLQAKQTVIDSVLQAAGQELRELDDEEYFETILRMVPKYAQSGDGIIRFSGQDLQRLPEGFEAKINESLAGKGTLKVAEEGAKIDGGFLLDYGEIGENCSFDALIDASKEDLQDKISKILFTN